MLLLLCYRTSTREDSVLKSSDVANPYFTINSTVYCTSMNTRITEREIQTLFDVIRATGVADGSSSQGCSVRHGTPVDLGKL